MDNSIIINSKIYEKFVEHDIPQSRYCIIIQYLLSLYFQCDFNTNITEKQKHLINRLGIINYNKDVGVYFEIPLLVIKDQPVTEITKDFVDTFLELFPINMVKVLGYDLRANKDGVRIKINKFVKDFNTTFNVKYNVEEIKKIIVIATSHYLNQRKKENYRYTMIAHQFVHHKDKGSLLASWCHTVISELAKGNKLEEIKEFTNNKDL